MPRDRKPQKATDQPADDTLKQADSKEPMPPPQVPPKIESEEVEDIDDEDKDY